MLLTFFKKRRDKTPAPAAKPLPATRRTAVAPPGAVTAEAVPVYPPIDSGIELATVDDLIASQLPLITRLRRHLALPDEEFAELYMEPIRRLAEHINLLPASRQVSHSGAGGLFRLSLEIAVHTAQAVEGTIFSAREPIEQRREIERKWQYAAYLGALCSELYRALSEMTVVNATGKQWHPYSIGLTTWLMQTGSSRFFVRWSPSEARGLTSRSVTAFVANQVIPEQALSYLQSGPAKIMQAMMVVIAGGDSGVVENPLQKMVESVKRKVYERDEALRPDMYGRLTVGAHLEPHLLNAMRKLVRSGAWSINTQGARLWYGADGLMLVWRAGALNIRQQLQLDGVSGIPDQDDTLLDILKASDIIGLSSDGSLFHEISPPGAQNRLYCVRFTRPRSILGDMDVEPLAEKLCVPPEPAAKEKDKSTTLQPGLFDDAPVPATPPADAAAKGKPTEAEKPATAEAPAQPAAKKKQPGAQAQASAPKGNPVCETLQAAAESATGGAAKADENAPSSEPAAASAPAAPKKSQGKKQQGSAPAAAPAKEGAGGAVAAKPAKGGQAEAKETRIPPAPERIPNLDLIPKEYAARISKPTLLALVDMLMDWREGKTESMLVMDDGIAMAQSYITSKGVTLMSFVDELHTIGWSVADQAPNGNMRKLRRVEPDTGPHAGKPFQALVLRKHVAEDLGFTVGEAHGA